MNSLFRFPHRVRIHGGECGAVARALHHKAKINSLPAVGENVLPTTNERKSMSIKTNFKRLALVVVSALGFGMLSIAPSSAVAGVPTVTVTAGSASVTEGAAKETLTTATLTISGLLSGSGDTYGITLFRKTVPTAAIAASKFRLALLETSTYSNTVVNGVGTEGGETEGDVSLEGAFRADADGAVFNASYDSRVIATAGNGYYLSGTAPGYVEATFGLMLDTATIRDGGEGDYVYTAVVTPYTGVGTAGTPVQADLTFTVKKTAAAAAAASGTIDPSKSTAFLGTATGASADASISVVATAATTAHGYINVITKTRNKSAINLAAVQSGELGDLNFRTDLKFAAKHSAKSNTILYSCLRSLVDSKRGVLAGIWELSLLHKFLGKILNHNTIVLRNAKLIANGNDTHSALFHNTQFVERGCIKRSLGIGAIDDCFLLGNSLFNLGDFLFRKIGLAVVVGNLQR